MMRRKSRTGADIAIGVVAVVLASCGGGASTSAAHAAGSAAQTFMNDITADHFSATCNVVIPTKQKKCIADMAMLAPMLATFGGKPITGSLQVAKVVVHGTEALATARGRVCSLSVSANVTSKSSKSNFKRSCQSPGNLNTGLPTKGKSFGAAYSTAYAATANNSSGAAFGAIPLKEIDGRWYVNISTPSGF